MNRSNQQIKRDARVDFLVSSAVVVVGIVIVLVTFPNLVATLMNTPVEFYPDLSIAAVKKVPLVVDPKPHDCESNAVPYGAKYCHYEKVREEVYGDRAYAPAGTDRQLMYVHVSLRKIND